MKLGAKASVSYVQVGTDFQQCFTAAADTDADAADADGNT